MELVLRYEDDVAMEWGKVNLRVGPFWSGALPRCVVPHFLSPALIAQTRAGGNGCLVSKSDCCLSRGD